MFSDNQWLFHVDWWTSNTFQCGHQDSFWWGCSMHRPPILPIVFFCFSIQSCICSLTVWFPLFLIKSLRQADYDCGPGWVWEIISAAGSAWRDAEGIRNCHLEQVSYQFTDYLQFTVFFSSVLYVSLFGFEWLSCLLPHNEPLYTIL